MLLKAKLAEEKSYYQWDKRKIQVEEKEVVLSRRTTALVLIIVSAVVTAVLIASVGGAFSPKEDVYLGIPYFETTRDLYIAVNAYLEDGSPETDVAERYGFPIGKWDVSRTDFSRVFAIDLTPEAIFSTKICQDGLLVAPLPWQEYLLVHVPLTSHSKTGIPVESPQ